MVSGISNTAQVQPEVAANNPAKKQAVPESHTATNADTVQLSNAAQSRIAALQEATETVAQTTREAGHGDRQAQRLLAKEAASKPVSK